ncbi:uncharacterized protein VTP21DRAFT_2904 [Calcarisporiella thermophila]|uniref:uncharacterized protein n=1 Tax=Calcarisporiella thermophila TaxID=911321 RepID=UPI00374254FD
MVASWLLQVHLRECTPGQCADVRRMFPCLLRRQLILYQHYTLLLPSVRDMTIKLLVVCKRCIAVNNGTHVKIGRNRQLGLG